MTDAENWNHRAALVMGWVKCPRTGWYSVDGTVDGLTPLFASDTVDPSVLPSAKFRWNPLEDLEQAFMLVDKLPQSLYIVCHKNEGGRWHVNIGDDNVDEDAGYIPFAGVCRDSLAEAITRACVQTWDILMEKS